MTVNKPAIVSIPISETSGETPVAIAKPGAVDLEKFKSKRSPNLAGVETLLTALPHHNMSAAKDWVRLHPNEAEYWSPEFCFVHVPILGQKAHSYSTPAVLVVPLESVDPDYHTLIEAETEEAYV
jgi:hypothetical protein